MNDRVTVEFREFDTGEALARLPLHPARLPRCYDYVTFAEGGEQYRVESVRWALWPERGDEADVVMHVR